MKPQSSGSRQPPCLKALKNMQVLKRHFKYHQGKTYMDLFQRAVTTTEKTSCLNSDKRHCLIERTVSAFTLPDITGQTELIKDKQFPK